MKISHSINNKINFSDRLGNKKEIEAKQGESINEVLLRNYIPANSVLILADDYPISEDSIVQPEINYQVKLIEGYDINAILDNFKHQTPESYGNYKKRRLSLNLDGSINLDSQYFDLKMVKKYVTDTILDTFNEFDLADESSNILIGLSGGVDSSSLLFALKDIQENFNFKITAATFEDFDSDKSPTFNNAKNLADKLNVPYHLIPSSIINEVFNINKPLNIVLKELMSTKDAHFVMYIDHHTTRRALEVFAENNGITDIALGLHTTDLVAGLVNSYLTGYYISNIPKRKVGNVNYIYPLSYITKKELHLYYYSITQKFAEHSSPNEWELNPRDRNFYYYLADQLQTYFPGIELSLFEAHNQKNLKNKFPEFTECENCGSHILQQNFERVNPEYCDVCNIFDKYGYLNS